MWIDEQKDEENKNQNTDSLNSPSVGAGGAGNAPIQNSSTAAVGTPSSMSPTPEAPGQQFGTIQDYFKGNTNQGEKLGQEFTNKLDQTKQQQQNTIGQAVAGTQQDITANTINADTGLVSKAASDPTKVANNDTDFNKFMQQWNAAYKGPESFETSNQYGEAAKAAQTAAEKAAQVESGGGRQQILQDEFGVYGSGNQGLDESLLQQSSYFPKVGEQAKELGSLQDYLAKQAEQVNTQAQTAKDITNTTKQQTQDAFKNKLTGLQTDLQNRVNAAQNTATAQANKYTEALKSGDAEKLSAALKDSNLTATQKANIVDYLTAINKDYGAKPDLSNTYSFNPKADITTANVANAEDYAKAQALQKLTGVDYSGVLNPADVTKAGTIANPTTGLDPKALDKNLRQYLSQQEIAKLHTPTTTSEGSSTSAPSTGAKKDTLLGAGAIINPGLGFTAGLVDSANKIGNKIADTFGFGGGKGDASVTLPNLKMPELTLPKTANPETTKAITDVFSKPLQTAGSYQEGAVYDMVNRLGVLKNAVTTGQISLSEYNAYAKPLAQWTKLATAAIMGASSQAANSVKPGYYALINNYSDLLK